MHSMTNTLSSLANCQSDANSTAPSTNITNPLTPALTGPHIPFSKRYEIQDHPGYTVQPTWVFTRLRRKPITVKIMTEAVYFFIDECRSEYPSADQEVPQFMTRRDARPPQNQRILMRYEKPKPKTGLTRDLLEKSFLTILTLMQQHKIAYQETFWYIRGPELQDGTTRAAAGSAPKIVEIGKASIQVYVR